MPHQKNFYIHELNLSWDILFIYLFILNPVEGYKKVEVETDEG